MTEDGSVLVLIVKFMNQPNPTKHFQVSMAKSTLRILASVFLIYNYPISAGAAFGCAELLGILEELV